MRILHVIDTLDFGGAEKVVVSLANGAADSHEVSVCAVTRLGVLANELDGRVERLSLGRRDGVALGIPWQLARRIDAGRFDVVHGHNWSVFLETAIAASLSRVGCALHTIHGKYPASAEGHLNGAKRALRLRLERRVSQRFDRIVCVSEAIREYVPLTVGIRSDRLTTIHNGIADSAPSTHPDREELTFVTVGRLDAVKNHAMMLRAFARLPAKSRPMRLLIAGDGPERTRLEQMSLELGIEQQVTFLGFRERVDSVLAEADVFLLSSRYEGISIALLEAMRAGLPSVATRVGGIAETILEGRTGYMVETEDVEGFAQAMTRLADSRELRHQLGAAAHELQRAEFSRSTMLGRYEELYRQGLRRAVAR